LIFILNFGELSWQRRVFTWPSGKEFFLSHFCLNLLNLVGIFTKIV